MASLSLEEAHAHLKTLRKKGLAIFLSKTRKKKHRQTLKSAPSLFPTQSGDHIYVGNSASARAVSTLLTLGIGAVLNCAPSMCKDPVVKYKKHAIRYFEIDCHDNQQFNILSPKVYDAAKAFIAQNQEEGRNVLVHCYAGINRSATLAVAYIVEREQKQLFEVFQQCFTARHGIISNKSFQVQLLNFASQKSLLQPHRTGVGGPRSTPRSAPTSTSVCPTSMNGKHCYKSRANVSACVQCGVRQ